MRLRAPNRVVVGVLIALLIFGALSSFGGAVYAVAFNGAGVPREYLAGSPFDSYLIPGLILGVIVGGTQLCAAIALLARHRWSLLISAIAGFGMIIWVFVELAIILAYSFLQTLYFGLGTLELILVLVLLGIVPGTASLDESKASMPGGNYGHRTAGPTYDGAAH